MCDEVGADAELGHHVLVPLASCYLYIQVGAALVGDGLDVPGAGFAQPLGAAVTWCVLVPVLQEPLERKRQRDATLWRSRVEQV